MSSTSLGDLLFVTFVGWPGVLVALLCVWHVAARLSGRGPRLSLRATALAAALVLALGILDARRDVASTGAALDEQMERREERSEEWRRRTRSQPIADRLRQDLPADTGR